MRIMRRLIAHFKAHETSFALVQLTKKNFFVTRTLFTETVTYIYIYIYSIDVCVYINSMARKLPIQKYMGKIAVQWKSPEESEIPR